MNFIHNYIFTLLVLIISMISSHAQKTHQTKLQFTFEEQQWINEHPIVFFGYEPNWPPYEIYEDGSYKGIVGEYVKILERETGIQLKPLPNISWNESFDRLRQERIIFVPSCAVTPNRQKELYLTKPYISDPLIIVTLKDGPFVGGISFLRGKTIVLPSNYYTDELIRQDFPEIKIITKESVYECMEAVSTGEADATVESLGVVSYYMNHHGFTNLKVAAPTHYGNVEISMAFNKSNKLFRDIAQKVLNNISVLEENRIRSEWISVRYEYGITRAQLVRYLILGLIILILSILIFTYWNKRLKREIRHRQETEIALEESLKRIQKKSDERKVLLQEIHHRIKNNLQIVSSLIRMQAISSKEHKKAFDYESTISRIGAIALIHEMIYQSEEVDISDTQDYLDRLLAEIISVHTKRSDIKVDLEIEDIRLPFEKLLPLAIIVNELVVNSIKHAFSQTENPRISLHLQTTEQGLRMCYIDNGIWKNDEKKPNGFGGSLIEIFTDQLEGHYTLEKDETGNRYCFEFQL